MKRLCVFYLWLIPDKDNFQIEIRILKKSFCICYIANRQKEITNPCGQKVNSQTVLQHSLGIHLFLYSGKVPTRVSCCSYRHCLIIWWCIGRLPQPKQQLKKKSKLPCKHLLSIAGVSEQHINYIILFDIFAFLSQRIVLGIVAIAIRCSLSLWTLS